MRDAFVWLRYERDRAAGWALVAVGVALLVSGFVQVVSARGLADQLSFLMSAGMAGLACLALGVGLLLGAHLHDEWRRLDRIEKAMRDDATEPVMGETSNQRLTPLSTRRLSWSRIRAEWDRVTGWALVAVAFVMLGFGYRQLDASSFTAEKITYVVSGGCGALLVLLLALGLLLGADLRDHSDKLERIESALDGRPAPDVRSALARLLVGDVSWVEEPGWGGRAQSSGPDHFLARPLACLGMVTSAVVVVLGWRRAAGAVDRGTAMDGLVLALGGVLAASATLGMAGVRRRRHLMRGQRELLGPMPGHLDGPVRGDSLGTTDGEWTVPGLRRFHRMDCPALVWARREGHFIQPVDTALEPCLLCHRDRK